MTTARRGHTTVQEQATPHDAFDHGSGSIAAKYCPTKCNDRAQILMPPQLHTYTAQMGFGSTHRPPTSFARFHNDKSSNRTVSSFSLINDPDKLHATLGAAIYRTDKWSLSPLCGEGAGTPGSAEGIDMRWGD